MSDSESRTVAAARRRGSEAPPPPEPLTVPVLDSHTHLDIVGDGSLEVAYAGIEAARAVGVDRLVQVGCDVASSRWGASLASESPSVLATVALHPNEAPRVADLDESLRVIEGLAGLDRVRGIGETGLDTFRTGPDGAAAQEASFRWHIDLAKRTGK
ncbi:MAG TPA: TatD family hydrolase, partial [Micromonosporaceae bacterium]